METRRVSEGSTRWTIYSSPSLAYASGYHCAKNRNFRTHASGYDSLV